MQPKNLILGAAALALAVSFGTTSATWAQTMGGTANVVIQTAPPTLDPHGSATEQTRFVTMNIFEQLYTQNSSKEPIPELAEGVDIGTDGLVYRFKLRENVKFHNGEVMDADDAVASILRYQQLGIDKSRLNGVASVAADGKSDVVVTLKEPSPIFLEQFSDFRVPIMIMPAEEAAKPLGEAAVIGTGPFKLGEFVADSHLRLDRFEDYAPNTAYTKREGFGGLKTAYLDHVVFNFVPEVGTAVAGLESGQYDLVDRVPASVGRRLEKEPGIVITPVERWHISMAVLSPSRAVTADPKIRRAIQHALDPSAILEVSLDGAFDLQPGFQYPGDQYYVTNGAQFYNKYDPEKAKALLKEAGYNGEEIILETTSSLPELMDTAVIVKEQLEAVGFKTKLESPDLATYVSVLYKPQQWNLWFSRHATGPAVGPLGALRPFLGDRNVIGVKDEVLEKQAHDMATLPTVAERRDAFAVAQEQLYDQAYIAKFGDFKLTQAISSKLKGFESFRTLRFWGVWKEQ